MTTPYDRAKADGLRAGADIARTYGTGAAGRRVGARIAARLESEADKIERNSR